MLGDAEKRSSVWVAKKPCACAYHGAFATIPLIASLYRVFGGKCFKTSLACLVSRALCPRVCGTCVRFFFSHVSTTRIPRCWRCNWLMLSLFEKKNYRCAMVRCMAYTIRVCHIRACILHCHAPLSSRFINRTLLLDTATTTGEPRSGPAGSKRGRLSRSSLLLRIRQRQRQRQRNPASINTPAVERPGRSYPRGTPSRSARCFVWER